MVGITSFQFAGRDFPAVTWYTNPGMRRTYLTLIFVVMTSATNGYDGSMMNGLQTLPYWQDHFHHPSNSQLGLLNAIMSVGGIISLPLFPWIADNYGRRIGIIIGCVIAIVGVVLQTIGVTIGMFIAGRFFIGFGISIAQGCSPLLVTELCHPQHRATFTTIYNTLWYLGAIIAAWLTFGTLHIKSDWAWRVPSLVQAFPSILQLIFVWMIDESPRFLVAKGRSEQALRVLAKAHANGDEQDELVQLEIQEIHTTLKMEQEFQSQGWSILWKTKGNRHRMLICICSGFFSQWSGNGIVSYYLNKALDGIGYTDPTTQDVINGCLQIWNLIVAVSICFHVDRFGRRTLFLVSTAGMMLTYMGWTIAAGRFAVSNNTDKAAGQTVLAMIFLYYAMYDLAWCGLLVGYTAEILPYNIRAKGLTVMFFSVDLSLFFNQYVNPIALGAIGWHYYIVYTCWLAVELVVVYFFYIEVRNTPLEEIAKHFDGEDAIVGGAAATEKGHELAKQAGIDEKRTFSTGYEMDDVPGNKGAHVTHVEEL